MKTPTLKEKVQIYETLLHRIQGQSAVAMNPNGVRHYLQRIESWSYAHRSGNGELTAREQQDRVNSAFWKLDEVPKRD